MRNIHRLELAGHTYGSWSVLRFSHKNKSGEIYWVCRCECGVERPVKANGLRSGRSTSCGCNHLKAVTTHGQTGTPTFRSWETMKQRCLNPNAPDYHNYGGRGIRVYVPWVNSFQRFLADMGRRPKGKTLDRRDTEGDYTPDNCRWASLSQQQRNRRLTRRLTYRGQTLAIGDWADEMGLTPKVINWRLDNGWPVEKALSTPIMPGRGKKKGP